MVTGVKINRVTIRLHSTSARVVRIFRTLTDSTDFYIYIYISLCFRRVIFLSVFGTEAKITQHALEDLKQYFDKAKKHKFLKKTKFESRCTGCLKKNQEATRVKRHTGLDSFIYLFIYIRVFALMPCVVLLRILVDIFPDFSDTLYTYIFLSLFFSASRSVRVGKGPQGIVSGTDHYRDGTLYVVECIKANVNDACPCSVLKMAAIT